MKLNIDPRIFIAGLLVVVVGLGVTYWKRQPSKALPAGFVQGNGRLEATQIDIASKFAGRLKQVMVREGERVSAGQVVAEMEVATLEAALREAEAQVRRAENARAAANAIVAQRRQAEQTALAIVAQRKSELAFSEKQVQRSEQLVAHGFNPPQKLDLDQTHKQSALALLSAAQSQVSEAQAAIVAAQAQAIEAQAAIEAAQATRERLQTDLADAQLRAPRTGRIQYRLAEPGEILGAGGKILTLVDLSDVYMTVFLPEQSAGRLPIGAEARIVLDAAPQYVIPARVSYVAAQAQFTPKSVETASERQKLVFRVRLHLDPEDLRQHEARVKTGLPGVAVVRTDPAQPWPLQLSVKLPPPLPADTADLTGASVVPAAPVRQP